jgi:hypothetical protein
VDTGELDRIGTTKLFENDDVAVWEMRLAPGESSAAHRHQHDYVVIQIGGDRIAADFDPASGGMLAHLAGQRLEADVAYGNVALALAGSQETAINTGQEEYFEIIVEIKRRPPGQPGVR